jgi:hypothetical protein
MPLGCRDRAIWAVVYTSHASKSRIRKGGKRRCLTAAKDFCGRRCLRDGRCLRQESTQPPASGSNDRGTPPHLDHEDAIRRRIERPAWLGPGGLTFTVSVLSAASYVALYSLDPSFLIVFGTSPEEVGLAESTLIIRAAMLGSFFVGFGLLFVIGFAVMFWIGGLMIQAESFSLRRFLHERVHRSPPKPSPERDPSNPQGKPYYSSTLTQSGIEQIQRQTWIIAPVWALLITLVGTLMGVL